MANQQVGGLLQKIAESKTGKYLLAPIIGISHSIGLLAFGYGAFMEPVGIKSVASIPYESMTNQQKSMAVLSNLLRPYYKHQTVDEPLEEQRLCYAVNRLLNNATPKEIEYLLNMGKKDAGAKTLMDLYNKCNGI